MTTPQPDPNCETCGGHGVRDVDAHDGITVWADCFCAPNDTPTEAERMAAMLKNDDEYWRRRNEQREREMSDPAHVAAMQLQAELDERNGL